MPNLTREFPSLMDYGVPVRADLIEIDSNNLQMRVDLPGLSKDVGNVKVRHDPTANSITVSGEFPRTNVALPDTNWVRRERSEGAFSRTICIPRQYNVNQKGTKAVFEHGQLRVDINVKSSGEGGDLIKLL